MPSATSRPTEPVGTTGISSWRDSPSLSRMMAPLPNSFSTPAMASSRALLRFLSSMGQCLLFFPILRTRSARKKLVGGSVIVLLGFLVAGCHLGGCDDDGPPSPSDLAAQAHADPRSGPPSASGRSNSELGSASRDEVARRVAQELEALEAEAGIERGHDPPAPGGDLLHDLEAFTTLDACARTHRITDPVVADAIDTLGYDTL